VRVATKHNTMSKQFFVEGKTNPGGSFSGKEPIPVAAKVAYIDDQPYEIKEGDTINKPTVVNNVETLACIPFVIDKGGGYYPVVDEKAFWPEGSAYFVRCA